MVYSCSSSLSVRICFLTTSNMETSSPNIFLAVQNNHDNTCFCLPCRGIKIDAVTNRGEQALRQKIINRLPGERKARSMAVFEVTKKQIIIGKLYKDTCMATTHLTYFKCWAKKQPFYQEFVNGSKAQKRSSTIIASWLIMPLSSSLRTQLTLIGASTTIKNRKSDV